MNQTSPFEDERNQYIVDGMKRETQAKFHTWMQAVVEKSVEAEGVIVTHIVNYYRSPWISFVIADKYELANAIEEGRAPRSVGSALLYIPKYWVPRAIIKIESVHLNTEEPDFVKLQLDHLYARSKINGQIAEILDKKYGSDDSQLKELMPVLIENTGEDRPIDPNLDWDLNLWRRVMSHFLSLGRIDLTIETCEVLRKHLSKIGYFDIRDIQSLLGVLHFEMNEYKLGKESLLEALIYSLSTNKKVEGSLELKIIMTYTDFTNAHLEELQKIIDEHGDSPNVEKVLLSFSAKSTEIAVELFFDSIFTKDTDDINQTLRKSKNPSLSPYKRGNLFEEMSRRLFEGVEGFEVMEMKTKTGQIDGVVRSNRVDHPFFITMGDYFLMEAKNWKVPVSALHVRGFADKIREARCNFGVIISTKGVTGPDGNNAKGVIRSNFERGISIIVLDEEKLKDIASCQNLIRIMQEKYETLRFNKPL